MRKSAFESKVRELKDLRNQKEILEKRIEILENELKQEMLDTQTFEYAGEDYSLSWHMIQASRFNQESFKLDHPKLFKKYQRLNEYRRFILK